MSEREAWVNQQLRRLDADHRSGRLGLNDYRLQRRQVLDSLLDGVEITERNALKHPTAPAPIADPQARSSATSGGDGALSRAGWVGAWLALTGALVLGAWLLYRVRWGGM